MNTQYLTPNSEQEWLGWRLEDLTSTEASALFGMSPYSTLFELWHAKKSKQPGSYEDNERIEAGRHIEPAIASLVSARYGVIVEPFKVYARDTEARLGSSFDYKIIGITDDKVEDSRLREMFLAHGIGILEAKNVDGLVFRRKWLDDETPAHIEIQLQHQLELTGIAWGCVAALVGGNRTELYIREKDAAVGRAIRVKAAEFWASIDSDTPPPVVYPDDADVIIAMSQFSDNSVLDARGDPGVAELISYFDNVKAEIKNLEIEEKVTKARILEVAGDAGTLLWDGGKVSLTVTKDSLGTLVTPDMVGTYVGGRRGYRQTRSYPTKPKEA